MNKLILGSIGAVLVLGGLVWIARPQNGASTPENSNGVLVAQEANSYDFGTISMAAGNVTHQFRIKNTGSEAVTIRKMYTSCMCTTAFLMVQGKRFGPVGMPGHGAIPSINQAVNPSEEAVVEVAFDPSAHGPAGVGRIQRTVTIENNSGQPVELQFSAIVTP